MTFRASFTRQNAIIRRLFRSNGQKNALQSVCNAVKADALWKLLKRSTAESTSPLCRVWCDFASTLLYTQIKGPQKNYTNYTQTLHKACILLILRQLRNVWFEAQTIHKLYIELYIEAFQKPTLRASKSLHSESSKPYTASVRKTIYEAEHKPYILFLNTNLANGI